MTVLKSFRILALFFILNLLIPAFVYGTANPQDSAIKLKLEKLINEYNIPGAVLTYGFADNTLHTITAGQRDISKQIPMTPSTCFDGGSTAKSMTAALILELVEQGKLQLDDTLSKVTSHYKRGKLSQLVSQYPDLKPMTLRQLLNHTSGVPQSINTQRYKDQFKKNRQYYWSSEALVQLAMQQPVYFKPGTPNAWSYTNTDYILLGLVVEAVTGLSIAENYQILWDKAHLHNLYYAQDGVIPQQALPKLAKGYLPLTQGIESASPFKDLPILKIPGKKEILAYSLCNSYNSNAPGAGGVIINSVDLAQWYRALFQNNLLTGNSIKEMLTSVRNARVNDSGYGLGVAIHKIPDYGYIISHDGLTPGYSVIVMYFVNYHLVLSLMTNSSNSYVSTFNVHNGEIMPGMITEILPFLIKKQFSEDNH